MPVAILLLLLYYHPPQTALLNIWKDHFNGWVESRPMWGKQNNCAGVAHQGENFGQLCMMLSQHPIILSFFFLFFKVKESCLLFRLRLQKQGSWCGPKERKLLLVIRCQGAHRWMGELNAATKLRFLSQHVWCLAVLMFESFYCNDKRTAGNIITPPKKEYSFIVITE